MLPKNADKNLFFCYSRIYIIVFQFLLLFFNLSFPQRPSLSYVRRYYRIGTPIVRPHSPAAVNAV